MFGRRTCTHCRKTKTANAKGVCGECIRRWPSLAGPIRMPIDRLQYAIPQHKDARP